MVEQLFGSKTRVKLLKLFYSNPNRSFYVREITRKVDEQINSVRRELSNLLSVGIISSDTTNNKLYYEVNQAHEHYQPLQMIFGQGVAPQKTTSTEEPFEPSERDALKKLGNIEIALYTGQFTRDESSGVDFLVVGDINHNALHKFVAELEAQEGKEVRFAVFSLDEFEYRYKIKDRFVHAVIDAKKQVLVDKRDILR